MDEFDDRFGDGRDSMERAISTIEAALRAALSDGGKLRPTLAREVLSGGVADPHLERWLESVAAELQNAGGALVPDDLVDLLARRMLAERRKSLEAHGAVSRSLVRALNRHE
jgi:hypothetical protein